MIWPACVIKAQGTNLQLLYVEYWCASSNSHILWLTLNSTIMPDERWYWLVSYYLLLKVCNKCNGFKCVGPIADVLEAAVWLMSYPRDSETCITPWHLTQRDADRSRLARQNHHYVCKYNAYKIREWVIQRIDQKNVSWKEDEQNSARSKWAHLEGVYCGECNWAEPSVAWCNTQKGEIIIMAE